MPETKIFIVARMGHHTVVNSFMSQSCRVLFLEIIVKTNNS